MRDSRAFSRGTFRAVFALSLAVAAAAALASRDSKDPLAAEIDRWSSFLRNNPRTDETWTDIKKSTEPAISRAEEALRAGRRLFALNRLAAARLNLAAAAYVGGLPAQKTADIKSFEAEWSRVGESLRKDLGKVSPAALDGVRPSAVRALGEAALLQVRAFYEASLDYGRNTMPQSGFFYLGAAQAQKDFTAFCRTLSEPAARRAPPLRPLAAELDALEDDLLSAYKPPASIDKHGEFIRASASLKESRDLDAAGLRHGALLRYLEAVQRFAPLRAAVEPGKTEPVVQLLKGFETRLGEGSADQSIGRLFLETAQAELAATPDSPVAAGIARDVLPRYFAALEPSRPAPARPQPRATVTLVRWPYT